MRSTKYAVCVGVMVIGSACTMARFCVSTDNACDAWYSATASAPFMQVWNTASAGCASAPGVDEPDASKDASHKADCHAVANTLPG